MLKFIGQALGHSFGLVVIVLFTTIGLAVMSITGATDYTVIAVVDGIYAGGYMLIPFMTLMNKYLEGRTVRKEIKKEVNTKEWSKEFNYQMSKKTNKAIDKDILKTQKKLNKLKVKEAAKPVKETMETEKHEEVFEVSQDTDL